MSFYDVFYYQARHKAVIAANFNYIVRIMIPDYAERNQRICEVESKWSAAVFGPPYDRILPDLVWNVHPFIRDASVEAFCADAGDEDYLMYGRVNDYGTYRVEKELDFCPWNIVGSECCRASMMTTEEMGKVLGAPDGPFLNFSMVESQGCGDLHCRVVAENRDKYPLPEAEGKPLWEVFGPIATADQIKFTPEEEMIKDPQMFTVENGYAYHSGLNLEKHPEDSFRFNCSKRSFLGCNYTNNLIKVMLDNGEVTDEYMKHLVRCVFEASGKTAFGDFFATKGLRDWLGVPGDVNDGRVLGGYIEMILNARMVPFETLAFNKDEVVYDITRDELGLFVYIDYAYVCLFNGMAKTLLDPRWAVWEETEGVGENTIRIKIAKKVDKYA
jgi:hypothetical protein